MFYSFAVYFLSNILYVISDILHEFRKFVLIVHTKFTVATIQNAYLRSYDPRVTNCILVVVFCSIVQKNLFRSRGLVHCYHFQIVVDVLLFTSIRV